MQKTAFKLFKAKYLPFLGSSYKQIHLYQMSEFRRICIRLGNDPTFQLKTKHLTHSSV